jgi:predicted ferric reductase
MSAPTPTTDRPEPREGSRVQVLLQTGQSLIGTRRDWRLVRPGPMMWPHPGRHWVGPLVVIASVVLIWPAFAGTAGEDGDVSVGLYLGAVSITLMAWSFVLAVRMWWLEPWFGGLDRVYRVHRWAGALAVVAMYLHTSQVDELLNGVSGASEDLAEAAEELAGTGQNMLYVLVALSVLRLMPYRWWRWTHKLLGVPFAFASFHFFTAEKPYANTSGWGWYFNAVMLLGLAAWVWRVAGRDVLGRGLAHRVAAMTVSGDSERGGTVDLRLVPEGRALRHRPGQFVFLRAGGGRGEPHPFSLSSSPDDDAVRLIVRGLGDWTSRLGGTIAVGDRVRLEGPYGRFRPLPDQPGPTIWIAGGVGITPMLSAVRGAAERGIVPHLLYAVRSEDDAVALDELRGLDTAGRIDLHLFVSHGGRRMVPEDLERIAETVGDGTRGLAGVHVALCGPSALVRTMANAAHRLGARGIQHEEFDIRSGIGPDLSEESTRAVELWRASRASR